MKLYTEEQVKQMIDRVHNGYDGYYDVMSPFAPIELPSDDEIDIYVKSHNYDDMFENLLEYGAKWMRDKIINQNK